ncbi:signaling mucin MSB2-like [Tripterygium wilfordii]|uniref:Signaling mucin MSB2-like n=1 Tax=Tripterygium wilfordii TaxID=458696 RepID=A0A7J7DDX1_TRIWF|nr:uncharacterized protein LOC120001728 [Tripterygium wilfordii]KAF5744532.1 signaling mucin MSB2-like [Tripterygium wilfordii]
MGVDAKNVLVYMWKTLRFLMITSYRFIQNYPLVSGTLIFFFLLFMFLPGVFYFLIYSSPFVACSAVFVRVYFKSQQKDKDVVRNGKEEERISSARSKSLAADGVVNRINGASSLRHQKSVRRNFTEKNRECNSRDLKMGENIISKGTLDDTLFGKSVQKEKVPKLESEEKNEFTLIHGESASCSASASGNVQLFDEHRPGFVPEPSIPDTTSQNGYDEESEKYYGNGASELDVSYSEGEEDEEEARVDGNNKAVEWTKDDEKNLMDLGDSELERNKRLESLIAKRRARKLYRLHAEKNLIDMDSAPMTQVAPILISRNNPFDILDNPNDLLGLQMPGSAPSVLLPARNPFDLPYDPQEEKPDLTADSFHQEFSAPHQKEMLFCRHESFCLGPFSSLEPNQLGPEPTINPFFNIDKKAPEGPGLSRFKTQRDKGNHDQLIEQLSSREGGSMFHTASVTDLVIQGPQPPNKVTSKAESNKEIDSHLDMKGAEIRKDKDKELTLSFGSETQMKTNAENNIDGSSPSSSSEDDEHNFNLNRAKVSEVLQPTADKFPEAFSRAVKKTFICPLPKRKTVSEPSYDSSPSAVEKLKMEDRPFYMEKVCHTPSLSIASDLQVEVSELGSPLTVDGNVSSGDEDSLIYDGDIDRDITSGSEEMWGASFHGVREDERRLREINEISEEDAMGESLSTLEKKPENPFGLSTMSEEVGDQDSNYVSSESSLRTETPQVSQASMSFSDNVKQVAEEVGEHRSSNSTDALSTEEAVHNGEGSVACSPQEVIPEKLEEALTSPGKSTREIKEVYDVDDPIVHANGEPSKPADGGGNADNTVEHQAVLEHGTQSEENKNMKLIGDMVGDEGDPIEHKENEDISKSVDGSKEVESTTDVGGSGVIIQSSTDPLRAAETPEFAVEQDSINSSTSSSPTSVLPNETLRDQISSSDFDQQGVLQSDTEIILRNRALDEHPPENLTLNMSENQTPSVRESLNQQSVDGNSTKSEETHNTQSSSTN